MQHGQVGVAEHFPLWANVREEIETFQEVMVLARSSWKEAGTSYAVDVSTGYGISLSGWNSSHVARVARVSDRRRWKLGGGSDQSSRRRDGGARA